MPTSLQALPQDMIPLRAIDTALQTLMDEVAADTFGSLDEGYAAQAQAEAVKAWQGRQ